MAQIKEFCLTHKRFGTGPYCASCVCNIDGCLGALNNCCEMVDVEVTGLLDGIPEVAAHYEKVARLFLGGRR